MNEWYFYGFFVTTEDEWKDHIQIVEEASIRGGDLQLKGTLSHMSQSLASKKNEKAE